MLKISLDLDQPNQFKHHKKLSKTRSPANPKAPKKKRKKERLEGTSTTYENKVVGVHLI